MVMVKMEQLGDHRLQKELTVWMVSFEAFLKDSHHHFFLFLCIANSP